MKNPYNDNHALRHEAICDLYGLDPHVHNIKEAEEAPRTKFYGWPEAERYPLDTPERTVLSWAYANEDTTGETRDKVLANIKKAADFWKVELPSRKEASADDAKHVITIKGEGWEDSYKISNATELKSIVDYIRKNASDFSYTTRVQYAEGISSAPAELKESLSTSDFDWIRRVKGEMLTDGKSVKKACDKRAFYLEELHEDDTAGIFRRLSAKIADDDVLKTDTVRKVAAAMDIIDRTYGLNVMYGQGIIDLPELDIKGMTPETVKQAYDNMVFLDDGTLTARSRILEHRDKVDDFFSKVSGEDTSSFSLDQIVDRITKMDSVERDAFKDILGETL